MWQTKLFKTQESMNKWIASNAHKIQYVTLYINNGYGIEYRKLLRIY